MKSVLISVTPKFCEKIASGEKTIEVRKTRPKLETPFKCFIYCTKGVVWDNRHLHINEPRKRNDHGITNRWLKGYDTKIINGGEFAYECYLADGKVIGEFICDRIDKYTAEFENSGECYEDVRRVWIDEDGEDDFEIVTGNDRDNPEDCELLKNSCLCYAELKKYIGENFHDIPFYGWHISDLKIYDKPKELSEFNLTRSPQGWQYIETQGE